MKIDKEQILEHLRSLGKTDEADKAQRDLPDQVDPDDDAHKSLLSRFGAEAGELKNKFGGFGKKL
jgi:hypothetical protein